MLSLLKSPKSSKSPRSPKTPKTPKTPRTPRTPKSPFRWHWRRSRPQATQVQDGSVPVLNGFATLPEADAIQIDSLGEACFLLPEEALTFKPRPSDIISTFKNGDQERKIHHNVELHEAERRPLQELQKLARTRGISFSPSVARAATRYLSHAKGDPHRALKLMQATQAWRLEYFGNGPITDASIAEDMRRGIVYFTGRDWALRPVLIFRPDRIPQAWHK